MYEREWNIDRAHEGVFTLADALGISRERLRSGADTSRWSCDPTEAVDEDSEELEFVALVGDG